MSNELAINTEFVIQVLTRFVQTEVTRVGLKNALLGLSGGVDSATVAFLCAKALGPEHVWGMMMPYRTSAPESLEDARKVVAATGIQSREIDITPMVDAYYDPARWSGTEADILRKGNKMARERMSILYDLSAELGALVVGTSNKTEILLGYGTIYGDMASALNPIGDLYKTQVKQVAMALGVPDAIIQKQPSADLWQGQTDEGELGITYAEVDKLLYHLIDERAGKKELIALGFEEKRVSEVIERVRRMQFKRKPPLIAKVSKRTVDYDFQYARDWGG
jgi:NAD+ synthase